MPILVSTPAGSGHNASHQPAFGISVPSKNPAGLSVTTVWPYGAAPHPDRAFAWRILCAIEKDL
jgi:hypothetical protein